MRFSAKTMATLTCVLAATSIASRLSADPPPSDPNRLPGQSHNRMLCIKSEGRKLVFVNMPGHFDLGSPSISPDGRWIVFDAMTIGKKPVRESWLLGVDGKGLKRLVKGAAPRWSPDGKRILFTQIQPPAKKDDSVEKHSVVELELATGREHKIVEGRFGDWSPDGTQIAFAREGETTPDSRVHLGSKIFTAKANGSDATELVDGDWPSWSPDGRAIAYCVHEENVLPQMHVIDVKEKKSEPLGVGYYRGQWSPDGKSVYCNGLIPGTKREELRNVPARLWLDKSKMEFLFLDMDMSSTPCISRDGKTLAVIVDSEGPARTLEEIQEEEEEEKLETEPPINPGG
jgi:Tol biopolymer transport system component